MKHIQLFEEFVNEAFEVHYSDGISAMKKFSDKSKAMAFMQDEIKKSANGYGALKNITIYNAGPNFHSTADTDAVIAWWGNGSSYMDNKAKNDPKLAAKKINEEFVNEAKAKVEETERGGKAVIIKTKDGKLHNFPNFTKDEVVDFLKKKGSTQVSSEKDLKLNTDFFIIN